MESESTDEIGRKDCVQNAFPTNNSSYAKEQGIGLLAEANLKFLVTEIVENIESNRFPAFCIKSNAVGIALLFFPRSVWSHVERPLRNF